MLETQIFERILTAWSNDQNHPFRDRRKKKIPSVEDLRVIIETSFLASLKKEEGKEVSFAVALLPKHLAIKEQELSGRDQLILNFDKTIPFSETSIIKLASALDLKTSALLVGPKEANDNEYEIWGVMFFRATHSRFTEVPAAMHKFNYFRPNVMMVNCISTGSLVISRGDIQIGRFTSGDFIAASPSPFTSLAMGKHLLDCIKNDEPYKKYNNFYWHIFRDSIDYLLAEASMRGHGNTIVIIPEQSQEKYEEKCLDGYSFNQESKIKKILLYLSNLKNKDDPLLSVLCHKLLSEHLSFLAQLSCADGALVITSMFKPISFGTTLNSEKWTGKVLLGPTGSDSGGQEFAAHLCGTRHNSAINFTADFDGAVSFVISHDGPIRGFAKKDDKIILCWPDCRFSMFI